MSAIDPGAAPVEGAPEGTPTSSVEAPAAPQATTDPVMDRMEQLGGRVGELANLISQRLPEPEPVEEPDIWSQVFGIAPPEAPPEVPPGPAFDPAAFQQAVQQTAQQMVQPFVGRLTAMEQRDQLQQIYQQVPQLDPSNPENAQARAEFGQALQARLEGFDPSIAQQLANNPKYIIDVFTAAEAEKAARGQTPANGHIPQLESAGGALPGGRREEDSDIVHQAHQQGRDILPQGFR